tara:strand:+ start:351 stop:461 length:111 start_codon:yes stop_codon:yes gene_type:complete
MLPSAVAEADVENLRVFHVAKKVENKVAEKESRQYG